jgi:hypothetical protein
MLKVNKTINLDYAASAPSGGVSGLLATAVPVPATAAKSAALYVYHNSRVIH